MPLVFLNYQFRKMATQNLFSIKQNSDHLNIGVNVFDSIPPLMRESIDMNLKFISLI